MVQKQKKRFFVSHAKSSALVVSLVVHALVIAAAATFVAVKVIQQSDADFKAKAIRRPKMPVKRLQAPVKMQKKPKPKLRKQITVKKVVRKMPRIKVPEITGIKGGIGAAGGGIGGTDTIGFTMPEVSVFGVKSRGEKIFILLDTSPSMLRDEIGGIPAYKLIKKELLGLVEGLPPTTLFNIAAFQSGRLPVVLFSKMVPASKPNIAKLKKWIEPLNTVPIDAENYDENRDAGVSTLGPGGVVLRDDLAVSPLRGDPNWLRPLLFSMGCRADSVFLLSDAWSTHIRYATENIDEVREKWKQSPAGRKWDEALRKGTEKLRKENKDRVKKNQPPKVLDGPYAIVKEYFPGTEIPPEPEWHFYTPKEITTAMKKVRVANLSKEEKLAMRLRKKKDVYSVNVIQFFAKDCENPNAFPLFAERFKTLTKVNRGAYRTLKGLDAIESSYRGNEGESN